MIDIKRLLRAFFGVQFIGFTVISLFMSDSEMKEKTLVSATYAGVCFLIQDGTMSKQDRWFNKD